MALLHLGLKKGWLKDFSRFETMSTVQRRGLVPREQQDSVGRNSVSTISVDTLAMHGALMVLVTVLGHHSALFLSQFHDMLQVPAFVTAFAIGLLVRALLKRTKGSDYFDDRLFQHGTGAATDFLIVFGIGAIQVTILLNYALPLIAIILLGLAFNLMLVLVVAPRIFGDNWFEKAVFSWGWLTGTVGMGIALLRIIDPKMRARVLDDYAIAYVPGSITDMLIISLVPVLMMQGMAHLAIGAMWAYVAAIAAIWYLVWGRHGLTHRAIV